MLFSDQTGWLVVAVGGIAVLVYLCLKIYKQRGYYTAGTKKERPSRQDSDEAAPADEKSSTDTFPLNPSEAVQFYLPLIEQMGEEFQLSDLYLLARGKNLPHPYLTINSFRQTGFLLPKGDGIFSWNHEALV